MARPLAPLKSEAVEPAVDYLRRAVERQSGVFSKPLASVRLSLSELARKLGSSGDDGRAELLDRWVRAHLTVEGRGKLLAALRRRRADASKGDDGSKTIRIPANTYSALHLFAGKIGAPMVLALDSVLQVALLDKKLQEMVLKLSVARSLTPRRPKSTR